MGNTIKDFFQKWYEVNPDLVRDMTPEEVKASEAFERKQRQFIDEINRYNENLRASAKSEEELTCSLDFVVKSLDSRMIDTYRKEFNGVYGPGGNFNYVKSGTILYTEISVEDNESGIKILCFKGNHNLSYGNSIQADVLKGEYKQAQSIHPQSRLPGRQPKKYLIERDFGAKETADVLRLIVDGEVKETYRAFKSN